MATTVSDSSPVTAQHQSIGTPVSPSAPYQRHPTHPPRDGIAGRQVEFELTESLLLADDTQTRQAFRRLKELGVQLALDDFGTGYSSLAYLQRFPIDTVKIDRSFINQLGISRQATSIINAVMTFAQTLNLQVTAEGIETSEQYASVRNLGCQFGQGYYFTKPLPAEDICRFLS